MNTKFTIWSYTNTFFWKVVIGFAIRYTSTRDGRTEPEGTEPEGTEPDGRTDGRRAYSFSFSFSVGGGVRASDATAWVTRDASF